MDTSAIIQHVLDDTLPSLHTDDYIVARGTTIEGINTCVCIARSCKNKYKYQRYLYDMNSNLGPRIICTVLGNNNGSENEDTVISFILDDDISIRLIQVQCSKLEEPVTIFDENDIPLLVPEMTAWLPSDISESE